MGETTKANGRLARIAGSRCCHQHLGVGRPTCLKPGCAVLLLVAPCHHRRHFVDEALHPRMDWMPHAAELLGTIRKLAASVARARYMGRVPRRIPTTRFLPSGPPRCCLFLSRTAAV